MTTTDNTSLSYKDERSDKTYRVAITPAGNDLFNVSFAYGRRGAALTTGSKTQTPVDYAKAKAIYTKLLNEKLSKGYRADTCSQSIVAMPVDKVASGVLPMLLTPTADETEVASLIADEQWGVMIKFDGRRAILKKDATGVCAINRMGFIVSCDPAVTAAVAALPFDSVLIDAEDMGGFIVAFDLMELDGVDWGTMPYLARHSKLLSVLSAAPQNALLRFASLFVGKEEKARLFERSIADNEEGVVWRRLDSAYSVGAPASGGNARKTKHTESATCEVSAISASKRSVELRVYDELSVAVPCGKVTIPSNYAMPKPLDIVEVKFLYYFGRGGALFQPCYLGPRSDAVASDCLLSKLKVKKSSDLAEAA